MDKREGSSSRNRFSSKEVISAGKKHHQRSKKERRGVSNQHELLEMLHVKLRAIEEDTNRMKEAVVRCVEERSFLMSEIARQLHFIRDCIVSLQGGDSSAAASSSSVSTLTVSYYATLRHGKFS